VTHPRLEHAPRQSGDPLQPFRHADYSAAYRYVSINTSDMIGLAHFRACREIVETPRFLPSAAGM
jgi:hypothetical protein